ncbi:putative amino acid permease YhdG [Nymphon striatum]|nr:putative amino acid permease YhdG [Nymphon striatum]
MDSLPNTVDIFGGAFVIFTAFSLMIGVKKSSFVNSLFSTINMVIILLIVLVGLYFVDFSNWTNPATKGFMPFGITGVLKGAGPAFFGFVGFENVASAAEEAKSPSKMMPRALFSVLGIASIQYFLVASILTLVTPYNTLEDSSSVAGVFRANGCLWMTYIATAGAISAMTATAMCSLYGVSRVIYAMAQDGLFFQDIFSCDSGQQNSSLQCFAIYISFCTHDMFRTIESPYRIYVHWNFNGLYDVLQKEIKYEILVETDNVNNNEARNIEDLTKIDIEVPGVPFIPLFSISMNLLLMILLNEMTWVRLLVWLAIGLAIYFGYGIRHSNLSDDFDNSESTALVTSEVERDPIHGHSVTKNLSSRL